MKNGFVLASALVSLAPAVAQSYVASTSTAPYVALTNPTVVTLAGSTPPEDNGIAQIPIGFSFPFYDRFFENITATANGNLWLTPPAGVTYDYYYSNYGFPNTLTPNGIISPLWDDLTGKVGEPSSRVSYQNLTGPSGQVLVIEWSNWNYQNVNATLELNFQVRLHESGLITFHYGPVNGTSPTFSASVGIENMTGSAGTVGLACTPSCLPTNLTPNQVITFGPPPQADLSVPRLRIDSVVQMGTDLKIDTTTFFRNFGGSAAANFSYALYLSSNPTFEAGVDTPVAPASQGPLTLASLGMNSHTASSTVPKPTAGSYYLIAVVDSGGVITESNEANNVGAISAPLVSGVDLVAQSVSGPATAAPGEAVSVNVTFANLGTDPAGTVPYKVFLSLDDQLSAADVELVSGSVAVAGGQNIVKTLPVTFPTNLPAGQWFLLLQIDSGPAVGTITEVNELNNQVLSTAKVEALQPDLVVTTMELLNAVPPHAALDTLFFGEPAKLQVVVSNLGKAPANGFTLAFYLSDNDTLMGFTDPFIGDKQGLSLAPQAQTVVTLTAPIPAKDAAGVDLKPADYFIFASASGSFVDAQPSTNVLKSKPQRLRGPAPDLVVTSLIAPTLLAAGEAFGVTRTLRNIGNRPAGAASYRYYLSVNTLITTSDILLPIQSAGALADEGTVTLAAGEGNTKTEWVFVPDGVSAGYYYIGVLVDPVDGAGSGKVLELSETNNGFASQTAMVQPQPLRGVITPSIPDGVVGSPYDVQLSSAGGDGTYKYELSDGTLPPGLALSLGGKISGTPTQAQIGNFTVKVSSGGRSAITRLILRVVPFTTGVTVTTGSLPSLVRGLPFESTLGVVGGQAPYRWTKEGGTLPTGLTLSESGRLSGTTSASVGAAFDFSVRVRDVAGNADVRAFKVTVVDGGGLVVDASELPVARIGDEYATDIVVKNKQAGPLSAPITWTVASGELPPGLSLGATDTKGLITGTPIRAGNFSFTLQVMDAKGRTDTADFILQVLASGVRVRGTLPASAGQGAFVEGSFSLEGAQTATFTLFDGALPDGLTLSDKGELRGTVSSDAAVRLYSFTVAARSPNGAVALGPFSFEVTSAASGGAKGCSAGGGALAPAALALLLGLKRRRRQQQSRRWQ